MVRALAFSAAFSLVVWLSGMNPVISSDQIELNLEPVHPPSETLDLETKPEKQWSPKAMVAPVLDKVAAIKVDSDTEDEYWVFDQLPFKNFKLRILRKETSMLEVLISGFLAGFVVELTNALLLHPIDTFKTRLQRGSGVVTPDPSLLYQRLFDGLGPVLATVPALSVFWAVKDIVRKSLILLVRAKLPAPVADVVSSTFASACGEAVFLAVKTPGQVLKIELQAAVLEEDAVRQRFSDEDTSYSSRCSELDPYALWEESLRSFPILCTVDVPQVAMRTAVFVALHDSAFVPGGPWSDILVFTIASAVASILCTPLDVARTQLILRREGVQHFASTLQKIKDQDGIAGLMAGWLPRLLWNGLIVGSILGLCRLQYEDAREFFMLGVLDRFEHIIQPVHESVW